MEPDIQEELRRYDTDYAPQTGRRPGIDTLPDGDHDFTVADAELTRTEKNREPILKLGLRLGDGRQVEHVYFFRTQDNVDRLGGDLLTLGFDADRWTAAHGRRFSAELTAAVGRLPGVRFRARKVTTPKDGKTYHNLYVNARLSEAALPPSVPPPDANGHPTPAGVGADDDSIPF